MSCPPLRSAPVLKDLHHLKTPVTDLATSVEWYSRVFGAERRREPAGPRAGRAVDPCPR
jgi:catechol 2,3-dioxygenase-like lactoylglutathione lyase family enzyme